MFGSQGCIAYHFTDVIAGIIAGTTVGLAGSRFFGRYKYGRCGQPLTIDLPLHKHSVFLSIPTMAIKFSALAASLALAAPALAQSVNGADYNSPTGGPPASFFAAGSSIPVSALKSAAAKASVAARDSTYPVNGDGGAARVTIHSDWSGFSEVQSLQLLLEMVVFTAEERANAFVSLILGCRVCLDR